MPFKAFDVEGIGTVTVYKRRGNRNVRLSLARGGTVRVSIPGWSSYQAGLDFVRARYDWILKQRRPPSGLLTSGMRVGKTRQLFFMQSPDVPGAKTSVRSEQVVVTYGPRQDWSDESVQTAALNACWRALKAEATLLLIPRLNELSKSFDFTYRSVRIKRMTSRWGSCDQHQNIILNLYLVQLPWHLIDYVILHELTHTRALHHGADFWEKLEAVAPNAKALRKEIHTYHTELFRV